MTIVSVEELCDYMSDISLTADQRVAARLVIEGVQSEIETALNRSIEPVTRTEVVTADHNGQLWPLHTPVISVISVEFGDPPSPLSYSIENGSLYAGSPGTDVTLSYVGGIGAAHRAYRHLRLEVLRIAAREMTTRHDDTLGVKDLSAVDDSPPLVIGITDDDQKRIRRWKRRTVA